MKNKNKCYTMIAFIAGILVVLGTAACLLAMLKRSKKRKACETSYIDCEFEPTSEIED